MAPATTSCGGLLAPPPSFSNLLSLYLLASGYAAADKPMVFAPDKVIVLCRGNRGLRDVTGLKGVIYEESRDEMSECVCVFPIAGRSST